MSDGYLPPPDGGAVINPTTNLGGNVGYVIVLKRGNGDETTTKETDNETAATTASVASDTNSLSHQNSDDILNFGNLPTAVIGGKVVPVLLMSTAAAATARMDYSPPEDKGVEVVSDGHGGSS